MSDEQTPSNPPEGSVPPVEPIVNEDLETLPVEATSASGTPASGTPTAGTPTTGTPTAETPAATARLESTTAAEPVAVGTVAPASTPSSHVMMPKWVVFSVVGMAPAALGFGVGWIAKPDDSNSQPAASARPFANGNPFGPNGPFSGNNGNNGGSNNGDNGNAQTTGAFLGVSATAASGDANGVEVAQVVADSPADDAGFEEGDVITKVDDTEVTTPAELVQVISSKDSGDEVTITYTRDGETKTADVTLGDRADAPSQLPQSRPGTED